MTLIWQGLYAKSPKDFSEERSSGWRPLLALSVERLHQDFFDFESWIRLHSGSRPEPHVAFIANTWKGSFLNGTRLRFNGNVNVRVGGWGAGGREIDHDREASLCTGDRLHSKRGKQGPSGCVEIRPERQHRNYLPGSADS